MVASKSPPSIVTSPVTSKLFLIFVYPLSAPILTVSAPPAKFTVFVTAVFNRLNSSVVASKSPPSMATSPTTSKLLLIFVEPVFAPILTVSAPPAKFTTVAVSLTKFTIGVKVSILNVCIPISPNVILPITCNVSVIFVGLAISTIPFADNLISPVRL